MSDFKKRMRAKIKEKGLTSSQFLDNLTDLLCDTEGLTDKELREDLEAEGVDVDKAIKKTRAIVQKHI